MHIIKNEKGFTLIEVIVSVVILSILAVSFVPLFGFSFTNIFSYGERDKAMSVASNIMEELYAEQPLEEEFSVTDIAGIEDNNDYFIYNGENEFKLEKDEVLVVDSADITGYKATIEVPYKNGERHVKLTSFVRGE